MRYFIDFEFMEDGRTIEPLSIGIVADPDGPGLVQEYYAEFTANLRKANPWVRQNVVPKLSGPPFLKPPQIIRREILKFIGPDKPEFWGYYADYDWVALCQIFGRMADLPKGWPMYCRDIKQWADTLGNPKLPDVGKGEHHALADARWNRQAWRFLRDYEQERRA